MSDVPRIDPYPEGFVPEAEAEAYYHGIPTRPRLVYRTGTVAWSKPGGIGQYDIFKELRPVFQHRLNEIWDNLGPKICAVHDKYNISWTSIDVVRFQEQSCEEPGPIVLWIGVIPKALSFDHARTAANDCLILLKESDVTDVEVEYRESIVTHSAGPGLMNVDRDTELNGTSEVCAALSPLLGLSISPENYVGPEGTGGLYLAEGGDSNAVLLLTARHVLFPEYGRNEEYTHNKSEPRRVMLLGRYCFKKFLESIKSTINFQEGLIEWHQNKIETSQKRADAAMYVDGKEDTESIKRLEETQLHINKRIDMKIRYKELYNEIKEDWSRPEQRSIGFIARSPALTYGGTRSFTLDYSLVALDISKFRKTFKGNALNLGKSLSQGGEELGISFLEEKVSMRDLKAMYSYLDASTPFDHNRPHHGYLPLQGIIPEASLRNPTSVDNKGRPSLMVMKNGKTSALTIGCATGAFSFVRYFTLEGSEISKEWAILPTSWPFGAFSYEGDSGSIIVDGSGRVGGLLTAGAGRHGVHDITYATPFFWLLDHIKRNGYPNAHINPTME
ncbi:hypothetical protein ABW21_db0204080 [Orbilia brochopaga]|nr:hypothetical protein ABW21_db0204080 [Drechslerella brochopaga]